MLVHGAAGGVGSFAVQFAGKKSGLLPFSINIGSLLPQLLQLYFQVIDLLLHIRFGIGQLGGSACPLRSL